MAILAHEISAVSAGELLAQDLRIPHYQRPYSWRPGTALQLLEDIRDARAEDPSAPYVLGAVILHTHDGEFDIVDGQQRLLTLLMIKQSLAGADQSSGQQSTPIVQARRVLIRALDGISDQERNAIAEYIDTHCQLVRIVTDDADEAFRVFDSQNYRGRPLAPHDLLKAHHLREMDSDSEALKAAAVETGRTQALSASTSCSRPISTASRSGRRANRHPASAHTTSTCSKASHSAPSSRRERATTSLPRALCRCSKPGVRTTAPTSTSTSTADFS